VADNPTVIKLAQPGYDVKTAGDENLIYNSNWPLLKIYKQGSYKIGDCAASAVIIEHDLGFIPFYIYYANTPITSWENFGAIGIEDRADFMGAVGDGTISMTNKQLAYTAPTFSNTTGATKLYYYVYALDITKKYEAPIIKVGDISGASENKHVFKIAKHGKDITSKNLDDYVIHSQARSPLIHSVTPSNGAVTSLVVTHSLGYAPIFFGFLKSGASYKPLYTGQGGSSSFKSTIDTITFTSSAPQEVTIVVLKDPFDVNYTVSVKI